MKFRDADGNLQPWFAGLLRGIALAVLLGLGTFLAGLDVGDSTRDAVVDGAKIAVGALILRFGEGSIDQMVASSSRRH